MGTHRTTPSPPPAALRRRQPAGRRLPAVVALAGAVLMVTSGLGVAVDDFPRGLVVLACGVVVAAATWEGVLRRGWARLAALAVAAAALAGAAQLLVDEGFLRDLALLAGGALTWHVGARLAFRPVAEGSPADRPRRPVLFVNPRSGDGRAARFRLAAEARARGIHAVELEPGEDLAALVRHAVDDGADALAMAGGDGSQAVVAAAAADAGIPYACIPSGTRNHFALDLGVDRDDVVGALDAFVRGDERRVDLGEVNGRVFVNNVSLGVYAQAVQRPGYRGAKMRTLVDTASAVLGPGPGTSRSDLRWTTPGGRTMQGAGIILVGNNQYRLGGAAGAGTRPALDRGELGVTIVDPPSPGGPRGRRPWRQWTTDVLRVGSAGPIAAGIDGEAAVLEPPADFRVRPGVLRVRVAVDHPGASPSSVEPVGAVPALRALARIALGRPARQPAPD
ncbi:MAG TPA: diacylglycerol kinase family protein [Blastococcus sp.]|nr:diacylglycerol kinase family protein [Blastococcus sp.]